MASQVINETSADSGLQAQGIIVTCPQTYRTQTILTDDWVTAVKQAPFPDACVIVKDPKCVLFMDHNGYPTRVTIEEGRTLMDALATIVRWQNAWRGVERKCGDKANG